MDIFHNLFDAIVPGGFIQIDDYGHWNGCRMAFDEFNQSRGGSFQLTPIDNTGVWFQKV